MKARLGILVLAVVLAATGAAQAGGRFYSGGHPYHNGYLFMPPSSAYEAVRVRPPFFYGVPAYYYPESYLGGGVQANYPGYYPPATYPQYFPTWRAGAFYMSSYGAAYASPW